MTQIRNLALLVPMFLFAACGGEAGAAATPDATASSLNELLAGITDAETAKAAKSQLESLTKDLSTGMESLKSAGEAAAKDTGNALNDMANKVTEGAKAAMSQLSPELQKSLGGLQEQITRLMNNEEIKQVLGPMLEKLKGLLPA